MLLNAAGEPIYMVSDGQSESNGRGEGGRSINTVNMETASGPEWTPKRVYVWDSHEDLGADFTNNAGTRWKLPVHSAGPFDEGVRNGNNGQVWAAHEIAKATKRDVFLIQNGRGGATIDPYWTVDPSPTNDGFMLRRLNLMWLRGELPRPAHVFIWRHGESNASGGMTPATYRPKFDAMMGRLMGSYGILAPNVLLVIASLRVDNAGYNAMFQDIVADYDNGTTQARYVDTTDLSANSPEDGHTDGPSQVICGQRIGAEVIDALGL